MIGANWKTEEVHISSICHGDTIVHEGELRTVGRSNIKRGFIGITLFGDSYYLGRKPVVRATPMRGIPKSSSLEREA